MAQQNAFLGFVASSWLVPIVTGAHARSRSLPLVAQVPTF